MIKRIFSLVILGFVAFFFYTVVANYQAPEALKSTAARYVEKGAQELGVPNLVTAVIVTYRGLDTLGEVVVLFVSATGVGLLLRRRERKTLNKATKNSTCRESELVYTATFYLMPLIFLLGTYIFVNGHLSPGGGFQGGAVIASGMMLLLLGNPFKRLRHGIMHFVESLSGFSYIVIGVLGMVLATGNGFLDNRIFSLGEFGQLFSGGAIPIIYILIGLKVGTELSAVLDHLKE